MDLHEQLRAMMDLAEELGMTIREVPGLPGPGDCPGGALVRVKDREVLMLDTQAGLADRISVAVAALADRPELADRFIAPQLRERIELGRTGDDDIV